MRLTQAHRNDFGVVGKFIKGEANTDMNGGEQAGISPDRCFSSRWSSLVLPASTSRGGMADSDRNHILMFAEALGEIACGGIFMAIGARSCMSAPVLARFSSDELEQEFPASVITREFDKQTRPTRAVPRGSPLFRLDLIGHGDAEITVGGQALQTRIFDLGYARARDLRGAQIAEALAPRVDGPARLFCACWYSLRRTSCPPPAGASPFARRLIGSSLCIPRSRSAIFPRIRRPEDAE